MSTIYLPIGMQGSGKTTWAKELIKTSKKPTIHISRDYYRDMLSSDISQYKMFSSYGNKVESMITTAAIQQATEAVTHNLDIVIADMNLNTQTQTYWSQFAKKHACQLVKKDFYQEYLASTGSKYHIIDAEDRYLKMMIERDLKRPNSLGPDILTNTFNKYLRSVLNQHIHIDGLPSAVIFDVDGTLASHIGIRDVHAYHKVKLDAVRPDVARMLHMHRAAGDVIIIVSGRDGSCLDLTKEWFKMHNLPFDYMFMREAGDRRKDSIIKCEIFDKFIDGKFNVHNTYDDRNQVVDIWRRKGLNCWQVQPGNF